jgi:hypothetical protein
MSLTALADDAILRTERQALNLRAAANGHLDAVFRPFQAGRERLAVEMETPGHFIDAEDSLQKTPHPGTLDGLVRYIPTESITLYVAATTAMSSLATASTWFTPLRLYVGFIVLTPALFL